MLPDLISDLVDNNVINSNKPRITNNKFIRLSAKHTKYQFDVTKTMPAYQHFAIFQFEIYLSVLRWLVLSF